MYIDGDTHYWPLRFIDKVSHPGKGYVEVTPDKGDLIRFGEPVPGKVATYYRDGNKIHSFKEGRWSPELRAEFMKKDGFDIQVLIPDNRMLIYELDAELGRQLARAYNETTAEDISGDDRFIGCAWIYLPDIQESIRELRRAVQDLGMKAVKFSGGWADGNLELSPTQILRQGFTIEPVGLHSLSWRFGDHRRRGDQAWVALGHYPIIQSIPCGSSLVHKGHLLIGKVLANVIQQVLCTIRHAQGLKESVMISKGHRDASLVHVQSRKHIVVPRNKCLASHRSASLIQWLKFPPLYLLLSTRGEPRHPSYKSQHERRTLNDIKTPPFVLSRRRTPAVFFSRLLDHLPASPRLRKRR